MRSEDTFSFQALQAAAKRAARGKSSSASAARFWMNLEPELLKLQEQLLQGSWQPQPIRKLLIHDPKRRIITVPSFRDRVTHQALAAVIEPRIERRFIRDTYACRIGAGTHAAYRRARAWSRSHKWVAHLDVRKYFPSIDHALVQEQWHQDRYPPYIRVLCERILKAGEGDSAGTYFPGDELFTPWNRGIGLPLGSLTSQLWANRYLDPVDHLIKDRLRVRAYLRYMDDLVLFHNSRSQLKELANAVEEACWGLRLRLHRWEIMPTQAGLGFVGYRSLPDRVRVKRSTVNRAERRIAQKVAALKRGELSPEALWASLRATFGHWDHADAWRLKEHFLRRLDLFASEPLR